MPIPFSLLPEHLQIRSIQKQNLDDFVKFHVCSRKSYEIAKKIRTRFTFSQGNEYVDCSEDICIAGTVLRNMPIRLAIEKLTITRNLSECLCEELTNLLQCTHSSTDKIANSQFDAFECTPDQFNALLAASEARELSFSGDCEIPVEILKIPAMKQIEKFGAVCPNFNDIRLLALNAPSIDLEDAQVSNATINALLKKWLRGERKITEWSIGINDALKEDQVFLGIPHSRLDTTGGDRWNIVFHLEREIDQEKIVVIFSASKLRYPDIQFAKFCDLLIKVE